MRGGKNTSMLPEGLKRYVEKRMTVRIALCCLLLLGVALAIAFYGDLLVPTDNISAKLCIYIALFVLPFLITGVPLKLLDRSYSGYIVNVEISTRYCKEKGNVKKMSYQNFVVLTIKTDDGNAVEEEIYIGQRKIEHLENEFKAGDRVYKFYGLPHILKVSDNNKGRCDCLVCGNDNDASDRHCSFCGHVLVDIERIRKMR